MLTKTQEQILMLLQSKKEEKLAIRRIARELNKSYALTYNNIVDLEREGIITKTPVPPAQIITLNEYAPTDVLVDIELKRRKEFLEKHKWIKLMLDDILENYKNPFFVILVFGSYAKGKQMLKSDIDVLVIVDNQKEMKNISYVVDKIPTRVRKSFNFIKPKDFREMIVNPRKLNIGNEAFNNHIILYGVEMFYRLIC